MQRIAITCGEQSENHVGMEIHGSGLSNYGFSEEDLISWKNKFEEMGALCELYDLKDNFLKSPDMMDVIDLVDDAHILIIRNGTNALLNKTEGNINNSNDMFNECLSVNWDKRYYDTRRKKVLNKHARYNNCFGNTSQNADLENIFRKIKINIQVNGKMIKYKEKEDFNGIMEIFMMEIGIIIKDMDMVSV